LKVDRENTVLVQYAFSIRDDQHIFIRVIDVSVLTECTDLVKVSQAYWDAKHSLSSLVMKSSTFEVLAMNGECGLLADS